VSAADWMESMSWSALTGQAGYQQRPGR
jgi:hypothetical protein